MQALSAAGYFVRRPRRSCETGCSTRAGEEPVKKQKVSEREVSVGRNGVLL